MNFQDLFARYREMGAMAPQQSLDEQLFMRNQNVAPNCGDPHNMDFPLPPLGTSNEGIKKECLMFKLPSPNTFQPFLMSMDEEQKQGLSGDEEVEDLLQPPPPQYQQGWNLGLLKTNNLCKDYYKLTSNMLHTLIMGIKEFTDGEISPAWQIAQDRGHQRQSDFSTMFLQDVGKKPTLTNDSTPLNSVHDSSVELKTNTQPSPLKLAFKTNGVRAPAPKELVKKSKDIDGILEIRRLLWRQMVPYTCLGAYVDPKPDGEKKLKLVQESRMKVVNMGGFGVSSDNQNCTFPETCQVSFKVAPQEVLAQESNPQPQLSPLTPSITSEQSANGPQNTSRKSDSMESQFIEEDTVEEDNDGGASRSHREGGDCGASRTEYRVSFPEDEVDMQLEEEYANSRQVKDSQQPKRSKFSVNQEANFERPKSSRSKCHAKETRFSVDGQILSIYDEGFEIVREEKENPSRYPCRNLMSFKKGGDGSSEHNLVDRQLHFVNIDDKEVRQHTTTRYKEIVVPPKSTTRSWCIVGGFSSRSRTTLRNSHSHSQKPNRQLQV